MHSVEATCRAVLDKYKVPDDVVLHSLAVRDVALFLADRLIAAGEEVDRAVVEAAALLHDADKGSLARTRFPGLPHGQGSAKIAEAEGFAEAAAPCVRHATHAPLRPEMRPTSWEEKLLWYADKSTSYRYLGLERRLWEFEPPAPAGTVARVMPHALEMEREIFRAPTLAPAGIRPTDLRRLVARRPAGDLDLAIGTTYDYGVEIGEMFRHVAAAGFTSVSLAGGNVGHSGYDAPAGRARLLRLCAETGLSISSVHAPFAKGMTSPDDGERLAAVEGAIMACHAAAELGAPVVVVHTWSWTPRPLDEAVQAAVDSVGRVLAGCPDGVMVAVENLPVPGTETVLDAILKAFPPDRVGFCYDTSHHHLRPRDFDLLGAFGDRLIATHVSDNRGERDDHQIPWEGAIDWRAFAASFGATDFSGPFLLEVETRESRFKDSQAFLRAAFDAAQRLLGLADRLGNMP